VSNAWQSKKAPEQACLDDPAKTSRTAICEAKKEEIHKSTMKPFSQGIWHSARQMKNNPGMKRKRHELTSK